MIGGREMAEGAKDFSGPPAGRLQIAAGCFGLDGYGEGVDLEGLQSLDAVVLKTTTLEAVVPARRPRFERRPDGNYWNYVGLRNPGIDSLESLLVARSLDSWGNLWLSLYAESTAEYLELIGRADAIGCLVGYEVNLSCPNLAGGKPAVRPEVRRLEGATRRPLRFKLSPPVPELDGIRSVVVGNSLPWRGGGLSGPVLGRRYRPLVASLRAWDAGLEINRLRRCRIARRRLGLSARRRRQGPDRGLFPGERRACRRTCAKPRRPSGAGCPEALCRR